MVTDNSGTEAGRIKYYPYGSVRSQTGTIPVDKKFTGGQEEGSLLKLGYRFYAPGFGQFSQPDPLPLSLFREPNPYVYARSSPVRFSDPTGLQSCDPPAGPVH